MSRYQIIAAVPSVSKTLTTAAPLVL